MAFLLGVSLTLCEWGWGLVFRWVQDDGGRGKRWGRKERSLPEARRDDR